MTRSGGGRRRAGAFQVAVLALSVLLAYLGAGSIDRAVRAARADGDPGRFTAVVEECVSHLGHQSCTCYGDYRSDGGAVEREGVYLAGGEVTCAAGTSSAAVDIGVATRVYHPDGSHEWIATALMLLAAAGMAAWALLPLLRGRAAAPAARPPSGPAA